MPAEAMMNRIGVYIVDKLCIVGGCIDQAAAERFEKQFANAALLHVKRFGIGIEKITELLLDINRFRRCGSSLRAFTGFTIIFDGLFCFGGNEKVNMIGRRQ